MGNSRLQPFNDISVHSLLSLNPITVDDGTQRILDSLKLSESDQKEFLTKAADCISLYKRSALLPDDLNELNKSVKALLELRESILQMDAAYASLSGRVKMRLLQATDRRNYVTNKREPHEIEVGISNITRLVNTSFKGIISNSPIDSVLEEVNKHLSQLRSREKSEEEGLRECVSDLLNVCRNFDLPITKNHQYKRDKSKNQKEFVDPVWSLIQKILQHNDIANFESAGRQIRKVVDP